MEGYVQPLVTLHVIIKSHDFCLKRCVSQLAYYLRKIGTVTVTLKRKMGTLKRKKHRRRK